jgi:hypothetical protein
VAARPGDINADTGMDLDMNINVDIHIHNHRLLCKFYVMVAIT